jgi:hypothetical protein
MTKISPSPTAQVDVAHAPDQPGRGKPPHRRSARGGAASRSARGPKTFQTLRQTSLGGSDMGVARSGGRGRQAPAAAEHCRHWIHPFQVASFAAIQSATTASTVLPFRSTSVIIAPISSLSMVKASIAA